VHSFLGAFLLVYRSTLLCVRVCLEGHLCWHLVFSVEIGYSLGNIAMGLLGFSLN
jgi:membrane protein YqaA with SNARE-associated domain